jgi:hypothetical protein
VALSDVSLPCNRMSVIGATTDIGLREGQIGSQRLTQSGHSLTLASTANKGTGTIGRFVRRNVYYLQNEH